MNSSQCFEDAMLLLSREYYRIVKVNLSDESYVVVKDDSIDRYSPEQCASVSEYLCGYAVSGRVHSDDLKRFLDFVEIERITKHFCESQSALILRYLRRAEQEYRWAQLEVMPCKEYGDDNQTVFFYYRDVHETFRKELEVQRDLEYYCNYDMLSGTRNFFAYKTVCASYILLEEESKSVGAIFADLNGLKMINDTKGHKAGDAFVMEFADLLTGYFSPSDCFRISGDEFAVISIGCSESVFNSRAESFYAILCKRDIPPASFGWAWSANPEAVEDVLTAAETRMYRDKESFYDKHPEYRRSAIEKKYKLEMQNVIWNLAESFGNLFLVDMTDGTYKLLRRIDAYDGKIPDNGRYDDLNELYCKKCVYDSDVPLRHLVGSYDYLAENLKHETVVSCDYRLKDGTWKRTDFKCIEKDAQGKVLKMLIMSYKPDKSRIERLAAHKSMEMGYHIINGLCKEYNFIATIDIATAKMDFYRNIGLPEEFSNYATDKYYSDSMAFFSERFVCEEDKEYFKKATALDNVVDSLRTTEKYTVVFHSKGLHSGEDVSSSEFNYSYTDNGSRIVFATRHLTNLRDESSYIDADEDEDDY